MGPGPGESPPPAPQKDDEVKPLMTQTRLNTLHTLPTPPFIPLKVEAANAVRNAVPQARDARLPEEAVNLHNGVIPSPLGRSSHGEDVPKLCHVAALDDIAQGTSDGSAGQNAVGLKKLRTATYGCSRESERFKIASSRISDKGREVAVASQLGPRSNADASARLKHSVALEDVPQNINVGSAGQNTVDPKKPRNATGGYSWKNKNEKTGSERKLQVSKEPTDMSEVQTSKSAKLEINNTADSRTFLARSKSTWVRFFLLIFIVSLPALYVVCNNIVSPSMPINMVDAAKNISQPLMPYLIPLLPITWIPGWVQNIWKNGQKLESAQ